MKVIGLTGGIASGKSAISSHLRKLGAHIIDADKVAREVVAPYSKAWQEIVDFFGRDVLQDDDSLNRKLLGERVFKEPEARARLNQITHPEILKEITRQVNKCRETGDVGLVVVDAPLLIETGLNNTVDEVWLVYTNPENQLKRLMDRDQISREQAMQRVQSQMPLDEKLKYAGQVIDNNGPLTETYRKVEALVRESY